MNNGVPVNVLQESSGRSCGTATSTLRLWLQRIPNCRYIWIMVLDKHMIPVDKLKVDFCFFFSALSARKRWYLSTVKWSAGRDFLKEQFSRQIGCSNKGVKMENPGWSVLPLVPFGSVMEHSFSFFFICFPFVEVENRGIKDANSKGKANALSEGHD